MSGIGQDIYIIPDIDMSKNDDIAYNNTDELINSPSVMMFMEVFIIVSIIFGFFIFLHSQGYTMGALFKSLNKHFHYKTRRNLFNELKPKGNLMVYPNKHW